MFLQSAWRREALGLSPCPSICWPQHLSLSLQASSVSLAASPWARPTASSSCLYLCHFPVEGISQFPRSPWHKFLSDPCFSLLLQHWKLTRIWHGFCEHLRQSLLPSRGGSLKESIYLLGYSSSPVPLITISWLNHELPFPRVCS